MGSACRPHHLADSMALRWSLAVAVAVGCWAAAAEGAAEDWESIKGFKTKYTVLKQGAGATVVQGAKVTVHATGVVVETGKKFWSTKDPGQQPFSYTAGAAW